MMWSKSEKELKISLKILQVKQDGQNQRQHTIWTSDSEFRGNVSSFLILFLKERGEGGLVESKFSLTEKNIKMIIFLGQGAWGLIQCKFS